MGHHKVICGRDSGGEESGVGGGEGHEGVGGDGDGGSGGWACGSLVGGGGEEDRSESGDVDGVVGTGKPRGGGKVSDWGSNVGFPLLLIKRAETQFVMY